MDESLEVELPRESHAPARARRLIAEFAGSVLDRDVLDRATLVVSELVTNAVLHGRGVIGMRASLDRDRLLVEVIDEGSGFERVVRERSSEALGGRGLDIVDAETSPMGSV